MKLIKKLLPIATVASCALIIAPSVASCAKVIFSTNNLDFAPSTKHAKSEYERTQQDIALEYFSNPLNFIQDIMYERIASINKEYKDRVNDRHYSDVSYSLNFSINSIDIKDVFIKKIETDDGWQYDVPGAYVSLSLTLTLNRTHTRTIKDPEELEIGISKEVYKTIEKETYNSQLNNYFVFILYDEEAQSWSVGFYANKDNDWFSQWTEQAYKETIDTVTRDGKEYTYTNVSNTNQTVCDSRQLENDDFREILSDIGAYKSYYLTDVKPKIQNN